MVARNCPKGMPAPDRSWSTSDSWELLRQHARIRKFWFGAIRSCRRALHRCVFLVRARAVCVEDTGDLARIWTSWSLTNASQMVPIRVAAQEAHQATHADFVRWLQGRAASVKGAVAAGKMKALWALVRRLRWPKEDQRTSCHRRDLSFGWICGCHSCGSCGHLARYVCRRFCPRC